jgi:hypothetical protein
MDEKPDRIRDYRDLIVWKEAMEIARLVYLLTRGFPREEAFGLTSQMRRRIVDSREYCRGLRSSAKKELHSVSAHCPRLVEGVGDVRNPVQPDRTVEGRQVRGFVRALPASWKTARTVRPLAWGRGVVTIHHSPFTIHSEAEHG